MFTFGIFTTHLPYITMVVFYAYFLIFGVNQAVDGKIKIDETSPTVQIHLNNSDTQQLADTFHFYSALTQSTETYIFEDAEVKQKWKHFGVENIFTENQLVNVLFGRPPPVA